MGLGGEVVIFDWFDWRMWVQGEWKVGLLCMQGETKKGKEKGIRG